MMFLAKEVSIVNRDKFILCVCFIQTRDFGEKFVALLSHQVRRLCHCCTNGTGVLTHIHIYTYTSVIHHCHGFWRPLPFSLSVPFILSLFKLCCIFHSFLYPIFSFLNAQVNAMLLLRLPVHSCSICFKMMSLFFNTKFLINFRFTCDSLIASCSRVCEQLAPCLFYLRYPVLLNVSQLYQAVLLISFLKKQQ